MSDTIQKVIEAIDEAMKYRIQLSELVDELNEARSQVQTSASQSRSKLRSHFEQLKLCINEALDERIEALEKRVLDIEQAAMKPLDQCGDLLQEGVNVASKVLSDGKVLLEGEDKEHGSMDDAMKEFSTKCNTLDLISLPEVPCLWETACITVDLPRDEENIQKQLVDAIKDYGRVMERPPVEITDIAERPAALFITWAEVTPVDGHSMDLELFRLQYCIGVVNGCMADQSVEFIDAYEGHGTSAVVRKLRRSVRYSFRVCGRTEGAQAWSPWSVPISSATTLEQHEWRTGSPGYTLSKSNTCAERTSDIDSSLQSAPLLYTKLSSFVCGHSLMIRVDEVGLDTLAETGVGITVTDSNTTADILQQGTLFVNSHGVVFVDGQEKTTRLPVFSKDSVVIFDTEVLQSGRVRVTVEVNEKVVTFDWTVQKGSSDVLTGLTEGSKGAHEKLFVFCKMATPGWRLSLE